MNLKRDIFTKCALLKRNYIFWILCAFNFFALAMFDNKLRIMNNVFIDIIFNKYL
jgi:hypothetical protein